MSSKERLLALPGTDLGFLGGNLGRQTEGQVDKSNFPVDRKACDDRVTDEWTDTSVCLKVRQVTLRQETDRKGCRPGSLHQPARPPGGAAATPRVPPSQAGRARGRQRGGARARTGRGQHAADAPGGGVSERGHARRRSVPFRAEAGGGKVAGLRGTAPGQAASATPSRSQRQRLHHGRPR
jgi:hypothetical protein